MTFSKCVKTVNYYVVIEFPELLSSMEKKDVIVVDVRNRDELKETGKLPGSYNVPCENNIYPANVTF